MKLKLDTPSRRIAFAIGISVLLHGFVLWGPNVQLPRFKSSLPALVAKLEPLPNIPARPKARPKHKNKKRSKPAAQPQVAPNKEPPLATASQVVPASAVAAASEVTPASSVAAASAVAAASEVLPASAPAAAETLAPEAIHRVPRPPLPQHAELTFDMHMSVGNLRVGEMVHTLDIKDGRYELKATARSTGFARAFKSYERNQYSSGIYGQYGLEPEIFVEEIKDKRSTQNYFMKFDQTQHMAHFSHGGEVNLPLETQDILSIMYQFPPLAKTEIASVFVSTGKKIESYNLEIADNERVETPLGELLTVHLRKMHGSNEEGFEIWLAKEYRLFPVKIRIIDKNGSDYLEFVITDMRVSQEEGVPQSVAH